MRLRRLLTDGSDEIVFVDNTLTALQKAVGGFIEMVHSDLLRRRQLVMVVDEEGLLKNLPVNVFASTLAGGGHVIVGPAFLAKWEPTDKATGMSDYPE